MRDRRRLNGCVCFLVLALAPGCQTLYAYRPIGILVCDAETKQPIPDAVVHISYPLVHASKAPYESIGSTAPDGVVRLQAAPFGPAGVLAEVTGKGYLFEQRTLSLGTVEALKPAGWFEKVEKRPVDLVIELYAEPRPTVELKLPPGFRGPIKGRLTVRPDVPSTPGLRTFRFDVTPAGTVEIDGPALLGHVTPFDYQAVSADGKQLLREPQGFDLGFWTLNSDGPHLNFFVGSRAEYETLRRAALQGDGTPGRPKMGGGGGSGTRHNRSGSQPGSAPGASGSGS